MLYLATASTPRIRETMARAEGVLGIIAQPGSNGPHHVPGLPWAADNGCFADRWYSDRWLRWLAGVAEGHHASCLFAVVPDVVANHPGTLRRWATWSPEVRALGLRTAFVLQDGADSGSIPWPEFDALFIGGSTEWKLSEAARELAGEAKERGKWLHMGRVNSLRRLRYAMAFGCDSVDGTFLAYGPDVNLPRLLAMLTRVHHPQLDLGSTA